MTKIKLRLQRVGVKNHHRWHIIAQAKSKHWDGSNHFERIGYWYPNKRKTVERSIVLNFHKIRFWLANGAEPTKGVHKLLSYAGLLPKLPIPYGSKYLYEKPKRSLKMDDFRDVRWGYASIDTAPKNTYPIYRLKDRLKEIDTYNFKHRHKVISNQLDNYISQRLHELNFLADNRNLQNLKETGELQVPEKMMEKVKKPLNTDCETDEINSDEPDFEKRKRVFGIVSKKLKAYFDDKYKLLRGKDLQYHTYIRKLEKLTRKNGLDDKAFEQFNKLVTSERERHELIVQRLSYRFHIDIEKREDYKNSFYKHLNNGVADEEAYKKFIKADLEDIKKLIDKKVSDYYINMGINSKKILEDNEKLQNQELIEDFKVLRFAKLLKKLKEAYLNDESKEEAHQDKNIEKEKENILSYAKTAKSSYLKAVENCFKDKKFILSANEKLLNKESYDSLFFHSLNDKILKSDTFKKFSDKILLADFSKYKEISDIYHLNDDIIDGLCEEIEKTIKANYQINDLFDDDKTDEVNVTSQRSKEIEKKVKNLKEKYAEEDINILYDDIYSSNMDLKNDINQLKEEYEYELVKNTQLEWKFKDSYKRFIEEMPDTKEYRQKFTEIYNKVIEDMQLEKEGKKELYIPNLETQEDENYYKIRRDIEKEKFDEVLTFYNADGILFDRSFFALDKKPVVFLKKSVSKKPKKNKPPSSEEDIKKSETIKDLNRTKALYNKSVEFSYKKSFHFGSLRLTYIMNRFVELFGNNNDIIYPEGFRHLENFEIYKKMYPKATTADYQDEFDKFCDFETFALINYGVCSNFKNLFILGVEFPELYSNISWYNVYLKSKSVSFFNKMKDMYKDFVERCERNSIKCTVIEAIDQYGIFNYQEIAHPKLKNRVEDPYKVDLASPFSDFTVEKLPKFRGETEPRQKIKAPSFINPIVERVDYDEFEDDGNSQTSTPKRSSKIMKKKFYDGRKFKGGGIRLH